MGLHQNLMHSSNNKYCLLVNGIFWITLLFSSTALKHIWGLETLASICNFLLLLSLAGFSIFYLFEQKIQLRYFIFFVMPSVLIIAGILLNIVYFLILYGIYSLSITIAIPFMAVIFAVYLERSNVISSLNLWRKYYIFMLIISILGILEYAAIFNGFYPTKIIDTPYGEFATGYFSLFYPVGNGDIHYRYYGCFVEPGTQAMYLIPAILYSIIYKKYIGAALFIVAIFLSDSLGAYISLALIFVMLPFFYYKTINNKFLIALCSISVSLIIFSNFGSYIQDMYNERSGSREERENNIETTLNTLPRFIVENPLGLPPFDSTSEAMKNSNYLGFTFTPAIYFQVGGFLSGVGYIYFLLVSFGLSIAVFTRRNIQIQDKLVLTTIIVTFPYIFQRNTIFESTIFALLFIPSLIRTIHFTFNRTTKNSVHAQVGS